MASTSLYAPQASATQPAFVYDNTNETGEVKISFSFSAYNTINDISGVLVSVVDPNASSLDGNNNMVKDGNYIFIDVAAIQLDTTTKKYYFNLNTSALETLTLNQYYQVQLYFIEKGVTIEENINDWVEANKDNISTPSQITLIYPIAKGEVLTKDTKCIVWPKDKDETFKIGNHQFEFKIIHRDNNFGYEPIVDYDLELFDGRGRFLYKKYNIRNNSLPNESLKYYFDQPVSPSVSRLKLIYRTLHGFEGCLIYDFDKNFALISTIDYKKKYGIEYKNIIDPSDVNKDDYMIPYASIEKIKFDTFAIDLNHPIPTTLQTNLNMDTGLIQISSFENYFNTSYLIKKDLSNNEAISIIAKHVRDESSYKPNFVVLPDFNNQEVCYGIAEDNLSDVEEKSLNIKFDLNNLEDIFLSDETMLMPVRYNPNISSFKWVVQENITNTIGGTFPIVRRNGDTYYRQFTLGGTLFCNNIEYAGASSSVPSDSSNKDMTSFIEGFGASDVILFAGSPLSSLTKLGKETQVRHLMEAFLTNGKPKLFRSAEEGNMIIYLSNVSFTPNKQLGRHVYDFSATATEICECTAANLEKYKLNLTNSLSKPTDTTVDFETGGPVLAIDNLNEEE